LSFVCVDASFALKIVLPEKESGLVSRMWEKWGNEDTTIIAPWLFAFEAMSVLRQKVTGRSITPREGWTAWETLLDLCIELRHHENLWKRAWELALRYHRPTIYDTSYLALAEMFDCDLWTTDRRFLNAVGGQESRLRSPGV
jgi:predicted nucleic acid-binding protein